ncbi:MAG TPA: GH92 family glycosyl hydrolase [Bacteroidales bacterium]|nr:GH92 family glycosyl hydrolase [Bacteroidales bacterium]HPS50556.1 GH92 family glycosyl hydrolase [Bacteroidales bacterium]
MNPKLIRALTCLMALFSIGSFAQQNVFFTDYVNPLIGTWGHGHTFPGATVPFGMVQVSPDTRLEGWDGCSAYHGSDSVIYGFSHTHLSGTGCSDYGDILIMPFTGNYDLNKGSIAAKFRKDDEVATAGIYRVGFSEKKIRAEVTATLRCGMHRYTFEDSENAGIGLDLEHRDKVLESALKIRGNNELEGYRISQAWAEKQMVYFVIRFSEPFDSFEVSDNGQVSSTRSEFTGTKIKASFRFTHKKTVVVKVGISAVSADGARQNLDAEISGWDFDLIANKAAFAWNSALEKVKVNGGTHDQQVTFYTALYHSMTQPNLYCDVDGRYRGRDLQVHENPGFDYYTVFSLWDTYRAAHPLYTIFEQKRTTDFINTFLKQYEEGGMLPVWELSGNETDCMIGYHAVPVIADAYLKGIGGFDAVKALEAMKHSSNQDRLGLQYYRTKGYIPANKERESVSKTLEYAYDDWCIAMMAKAMNKTDDYKTYLIRAQNYKNVFDKMTRFMRAKSNETWVSPFDPAEVNFNYTEANAWQYSFYAPQDLAGLMMLMGGKDQFEKKLDDLFTADARTTGRNQADITGLIGQYAHGNEPSHHMAYLYDYAGVPWKTQEMVHRICRDFYKNKPDGLIGNEDCGQMSAWYIFSAMGFYPVTPGSGIYAMGTPLFPKMVLSLENGKTFTIRANNLDSNTFYIQSVSLNGKPHTRCYLNHEEIMKGGELTFNMGPQPNKAWGTGYGAFPTTYIQDYAITPVPALYQATPTFIDSTLVILSCALPGIDIHYTLDGSEPTLKSSRYLRPMVLRKTTTLKACAIGKDSPKSLPIEARFIKIPKDRKIELKTKYANQYNAGGDLALIDILRGDKDFHTGLWQGYEGVDIVATVAFDEIKSFKKISLGCLQDQRSWIFMPLSVTFFISVDGNTFEEAGTVVNDIDERNEEIVIKDFTVNLKGKKAKYIRVIAKNRGICPAWHPGKGEKAWIFADEIIFEN